MGGGEGVGGRPWVLASDSFPMAVVQKLLAGTLTLVGGAGWQGAWGTGCLLRLIIGKTTLLFCPFQLLRHVRSSCCPLRMERPILHSCISVAQAIRGLSGLEWKPCECRRVRLLVLCSLRSFLLLLLSQSLVHSGSLSRQDPDTLPCLSDVAVLSQSF